MKPIILGILVGLLAVTIAAATLYTPRPAAEACILCGVFSPNRVTIPMCSTCAEEYATPYASTDTVYIGGTIR
jgi:hypothetical protein